jgi:hypothetical protein
VELLRFSFLTTALDGFEWLTSLLGGFIPGKEIRYPLNRMLGGLHTRCGRCGEEKNLLPLTNLRE